MGLKNDVVNPVMSFNLFYIYILCAFLLHFHTLHPLCHFILTGYCKAGYEFAFLKPKCRSLFSPECVHNFACFKQGAYHTYLFE